MGGQEVADLMTAKPQAPMLPDKPVNIGESWTGEMMGGSFKGTLLGFEEIQGLRCAKIQVEFTVKTPTVEVTGQSTYFLTVEEGLGLLMRLVTKSKSAIAMGDTTMSQTMELTKRYKLSSEELKQVQEEVTALEAGFAHLQKREKDAAKSAFQQFLEAHPESRFKEGVKGLIAQIDMMEKLGGAKEIEKNQKEE
jgi:soluble cytochrome b562